MNALRESLHDFVQYRLQYLTGDEKGEAQIFCDRLFKAFGLTGVREAGATLEYRLRKEDDNGTSFADLMFKPRCLVEMKRAGTDLSKHFRQAFDYWVRAVPNRPRYVVLCNFDEFWIYDFDRQLDEPVDRVALDDLPRRWEAMAFLLSEEREPVFANDLVAVTREAAGRVASTFRALHQRGLRRETAQRFVLQCVMAMFSEDIGLLPQHAFTQALHDSKTGRHAFDLLFGLFREMNTPGETPSGRYQGTPYFNGGLFADIEPIELVSDELQLLREAVITDWSAVRPEIFGTLFEQSMDSDTRHAQGAHFTSQADIARVVGPTIVDYWRSRIRSATSLRDLEAILDAMHSYTVLDPACGSGNFLYVAYREMRRLEKEVLDATQGRRRNTEKARQGRIAYITPSQFHGLDVDPFAVEIAKVTLLLGKKLAADELGDDQPVLPLDNLDRSIVARDALFNPWPQADAIVGNPPYLGRRKMVEELGASYCAELAQRHPKVAGVSDYVSYWFPLAHDALPEGGRAGFVATKTIRQGDSRRVSLDYITETGGTLIEAVDAIPWSGDAVVTVSVVNWVKGEPPAGPRTLWLENGTVRLEVPHINTSLTATADLKDAKPIPANTRPKKVFQGQTPGVTGGFELDLAEAQRLLKTPGAADTIHPFLGGAELLRQVAVNRWIIDIPERDADLAWARRPALMRHLQDRVLPVRREAAERQREENTQILRRNAGARVHDHHAKFLATWWQLAYRREDLLDALGSLDRYIALTRVSSAARGPVFAFVDASIRLGDSAVAFAFDDDYSLGVLQSAVHVEWFRQRCSTLKSDLRYTSKTIFDSFPWPQSPGASCVRDVATCAAAIVEYRAEQLERGISLAEQYDVLRNPGRSSLRTLHERLNDAVRAAYGFEDEIDLTAQLLSLNLQVAGSSVSDHVAAPGPGAHTGTQVSQWRLLPPVMR